CGTHLIQAGDGRKAIRLGKGSRAKKIENLKINSSKVRVYDIRNAGKHNRFTVSGKLVHNCGYGGSSGALKAMGAVDMGIPEEELKPLVDAWRAANPNIVKLWWAFDDAVKNVVTLKTSETVNGIKFSYKSGMLFITLPSGRNLVYVRPKPGINKFGGESVTYEGIGATKKWERIESYGPKFVENVIQAIARDLLLNAMKNLREFFIVAHVHDEVIIEADAGMTLEEMCERMSQAPKWAKGLNLKADGYECMYYKKD
ncbi:MAG: hypothetical protein IJ736_14790, partial [Firmicutes bacterium]|nr:hypothetical protein [Bacillota bacterium]